MIEPFTAPAIMTSISYTKDGGIRFGFHTNELTSNEKVIASEYYQKFGYLAFKPNEFQQDEIPLEDIEDKNKTPSKRLRNVLFLLHMQESGNKAGFETYYRNMMEKIIEHYKLKLD